MTGTNEENEATVEIGFMDKVRKCMGKLTFLPNAVAMYYCATDPKTSPPVKAVLYGALAYFVLPLDFINDAVSGVGFMDDAIVIGSALKMCSSYITDEHRDKARNMMSSVIPS